MTKISVCIPAYNRPNWLKRAILSIITQQVIEGIEIIISDDSTDPQCQQIVKNTLQNWAGRWHYTNNQPSLGMAENWNQSIGLATGEYVLILHDDDFLYPESLQEILTKIKKYDSKTLLFGVAVVDEQERVLKHQIKEGYLNPKEALIKVLSDSSFVRFPSIVIRRQVFEEVGFFNPLLGEPTDLDMWVRLFSRYGVFCFPQVTCGYTVHSQALTMGVFQEKTVKTLLTIFTQASSLLDKEELEYSQGKFFHQFILAGAFRMLRRKRVREFAKVMKLFELPELQGLKCPWQWWFLRWWFGALVFFDPSKKSFRNHLEKTRK